MASVCLRGERDAEQIEGAALGWGGGGKDGGEAIAPKADDIAGERGEIAKQGTEAVHREWFAICRVSAFAERPCVAPPARARPWPPARCAAPRGRLDRARRTASGRGSGACAIADNRPAYRAGRARARVARSSGIPDAVRDRRSSANGRRARRR